MGVCYWASITFAATLDKDLSPRRTDFVPQRNVPSPRLIHYHVLVDAVAWFFQGQQSDLSWMSVIAPLP